MRKLVFPLAATLCQLNLLLLKFCLNSLTHSSGPLTSFSVCPKPLCLGPCRNYQLSLTIFLFRSYRRCTIGDCTFSLEAGTRLPANFLFTQWQPRWQYQWRALGAIMAHGLYDGSIQLRLYTCTYMPDFCLPTLYNWRMYVQCRD